MNNLSLDQMWAFIKNFAINKFFDVAVVAAVWAVVGFAVGIILVVLLRRWGVFHRPRVWKWFTRLFYLYIPVITFAFSVSMGSIHGVHRTAGATIDEASDVVIGYAQAYLPQVQALVLYGGDEVKDLATAKLGVEAAWLEGPLLASIEQATGEDFDEMLVRTALEHYGLAIGPAESTLDALKRYDLSDPEMFRDPVLYSIMPNSLHHQLELIVMPLYTAILIFFAPLFLLPLVEIVCYRFIYRELWQRLLGRGGAGETHHLLAQKQARLHG